MFKKCKVVMLPTNKKAQIHIIPDGYMYKSVEVFIQASQAYKPYHLYITSDEEIEAGDWIYHKLDNKPIKFDGNKTGGFPYGYRKVIATTDSSLERYWKLNETIPLPQPSSSFIQKYVDEYNKGNQITDVLVEYEEISGKLLSYGRGFTPSEIKPKINPKDNTITIKKVKDSWTREEVVSLCLKMQHDYPKFTKDSYFTPNMREIADWTSNGIDENI